MAQEHEENMRKAGLTLQDVDSTSEGLTGVKS